MCSRKQVAKTARYASTRQAGPEPSGGVAGRTNFLPPVEPMGFARIASYAPEFGSSDCAPLPRLAHQRISPERRRATCTGRSRIGARQSGKEETP